MAKQLTPARKSELQAEVQRHIDGLVKLLQDSKVEYEAKIKELRENIPELENIDIFSIDPDSAALDVIVAKIRLYSSFIEEAEVLQSSPYFLRMDILDIETGDNQTIYIGKHQYKQENIFSWVTPISTLRYSEPGEASYTRPNGTERKVDIRRKDNYIISQGKVVFMTYEDPEFERQVVYQKHFDDRKGFLLPEIVAELDRLQDQIIRSDPRGYFLISGPAGSGKTTLALHRIGYLVLTPEFKDFFDPERIVVFVATEKDIKYFNKLLPELGINGVQITTFNEWALMIANSRYRASLPQRFKIAKNRDLLEYISAHNPFPGLNPKVVLDEYRRLKQQVIMPVKMREGTQRDVYPALHTLYTSSLGTDLPDKFISEFVSYLNFQKKNKYLDEIDLTVILMSLENGVMPFAHIVIDEVQNWIPEQLQVITSFAHHGYKSVTFIGDIRQKTKVYTIPDWKEIDPEFAEDSERKYELLKVYRNTHQILSYLQAKGYDVNLDNNTKTGPEVEELDLQSTEVNGKVKDLINKIEAEHGKVQIAVIGRYASSVDGLLSLGYAVEGESNIHVLTAEESQGLEFHSVIIINEAEFTIDKSEYEKVLGLHAANEYAAQGRHLFYVAATRAQNQLFVLSVAA